MLGWVGLRVILDAMQGLIVPFPCGKLDPDLLVVRPIAESWIRAELLNLLVVV
jgi:hypothetical protein